MNLQYYFVFFHGDNIIFIFIIVLFVETPRKFITAKLSITYPITTLLYIKRACELNKSHIISTDEDPGLRIESFAVINLRGVSTNKTIIYLIAMQTYKELIFIFIRTKHVCIFITAKFEILIYKLMDLSVIRHGQIYLLFGKQGRPLTPLARLRHQLISPPPPHPQS